MKKLLAAMFVALLMVGCGGGGGVNFSPLNNHQPNLASYPESEVKIFITKKPTSNYEELGILSVMTWEYQPDDFYYYNLMKRKASEIGANGVIILSSQNEVNTNYVTKQTYAGKNYKAMAIRF
jgi:hypothetical protein